MINNSSLQIHNKFELKLFDIDGTLQQEAYAYNAANLLKFIANSMYWWSRDNNNIRHLVLGDGDMAANPPTEKDKNMVHKLFSSNIKGYEFTRISPFKKEYETLEFHSAEHIFPATRDYIGDLSEIGISDDIGFLYSHAALVDAEENPIIIKKTENNRLKVNIIWYITPILAIPNQELKFKFFPAYSSTLGGCCGLYDDVSEFDKRDQDFPSTNGGRKFYFSPQYVPESQDGVTYDNSLLSLESGSLKTTASCTSAGNPTSIDNIYDYSTAFPFTFEANNILFTQTQNNFGFAHSIIFPSLGAIELPNERIIPKYNLDVTIGTGDGKKTVFFTSVNELATDANDKPILKVYFQNSETEQKSVIDSSEYVFTNFNTKKSPLWNKMIYVEDPNGNKSEKNSFFVTKDQNRSISQTGYCVLTNCSFAVDSTNWSGDYWYNSRFFAPGEWYSPVYYDEQGITLDEAKIGSYYGQGNSFFNPILYLYYKDLEAEDWTEDKKITIPASSLDPNEFIVTKFEPITAKYWKMQVGEGNYGGRDRISFQGSNRLGKCTMASEENMRNNQVYGFDPNFIIAGNSAEYDFSKVGLEFKTPPPAGTIITMEATLDLPYKTPDGNMTFSYQATLNPPSSGV